MSGKFEVILVLLISFFINLGYGQKINSLIKSLDTHEMKDFQRMGGIIVSYNSSVKFEELLTNKIFENYYSSLYFFDEQKVENNRLVEPFHKYQLSFLLKGTRIIYCLAKDLNQNKNVYAFSDKLEIQKFESLYSKLFGDTSNYEMLFKSEVEFGHNCGFGGTHSPDIYYICQNYITSKNVKKLDAWLFSHLISYKVWALYGLSELVKNGYKLSSKESKVLFELYRSEDEIEVCRGCENYNIKVSEIISEFKF